MESFSVREGIVPKKAIQIDSMDDALRNRLWNVLLDCFITPISMISTVKSTYYVLHKRIWTVCWKLPADKIQYTFSYHIDNVRAIYFDLPWNEVYDLLEFIANEHSAISKEEFYVDRCNTTLKQENSAFRFINKQLVKITDENEIAEIEKVSLCGIEAVKIHVNSALQLLSDRTNPDFRNSIKESISAVEAICKLITGKEKATLGQALTTIKDTGKIDLHGGLIDGFKCLYGWTSDDGAIRHAFKDGSTEIKAEDARYMLVSCSAFVNYLIVKADEAGISLA